MKKQTKNRESLKVDEKYFFVIVISKIFGKKKKKATPKYMPLRTKLSMPLTI